MINYNKDNRKFYKTLKKYHLSHNSQKLVKIKYNNKINQSNN